MRSSGINGEGELRGQPANLNSPGKWPLKQSVCFSVQLLDCYLEAYQHVFDRDERRSLAQVITNIVYRRPRFDFSADYFVRCYQLECYCLRLQVELIKSILATQVRNRQSDPILLHFLKLSKHCGLAWYASFNTPVCDLLGHWCRIADAKMSASRFPSAVTVDA